MNSSPAIAFRVFWQLLAAPCLLALGVSAQARLTLKASAQGLDSRADDRLQVTPGSQIEVEVLGEPGCVAILELSWHAAYFNRVQRIALELSAGALAGTMLPMQSPGVLDSAGSMRWSLRLPEALACQGACWIQASLLDPVRHTLTRSNAVRLTSRTWDPSQLPLLPAGQFMGLMYNNPSGASSAQVDSLWSLARASGLGAFPLSFGWNDIEIEPGVFDTAKLELLLQLVQVAGLKPFLIISTIDGSTLTLPPDLQDPSDEHSLRTDLNWGDAQMQERFARVLEHTLPMLVNYGGFYVSIGNEVDRQLFDCAATNAGYAAFLQAARRCARRLAPELALGTTVSWNGLLSHPQRFEELLGACDNIALTYFPLNADFSALDPGLVGEHMQHMLAAVGPRPLLLQEYGYPAGGGQALGSGSSEEQQRQFIQNCFKSFRAQPTIRMAIYSNLSDWGPADLGILQLHYNQIDLKFAEVLGSLGLMDYASGKPKRALKEFIAGLKSL